MAFTNLFSKLSAIGEDVTRPDRSDFTYRNKNEDSRGRKRKTQHPDSYRKKKCGQSQTSDTLNSEDFQDKCWSQSEGSPAGRTGGTRNNDRSKPGSNCRQNHNNKHNYNVKKQQQEGKNQKCRKGGRYDKKDWRFSQRGGRSSKYIKEERPRFMSQEFKDQNALLVDGRLLCRHFLYGRCIKEDNCQLEHIQGHNDLLKEACKFYIQGFCLKGERCLYMHNILSPSSAQSFPCKFFHRKGKCLQEGNCKFSHDPLNEVTEKLLDQVLQQEKDYLELRKEAKQDSSEPPQNADQTENVESHENPDVLTHPLRPNFYNSTAAEKEGGLLQTEERASEAADPHRSPSNQQDPVCYAVEAVLGPQLFRPLSSFSKTPGSEESLSVSACQASSDADLGSVNQSEVPYSVDAVLRSCKSTKNFTFGPTALLPAQTVSYIPQFSSTEILDPLWSSQNQNEKVAQNISDVANASQENVSKSFSSLRSNNFLVSKASPDPSVTSEGPKKRSSTTSTCQKPGEITSNEVKLKFFNPPVPEAQNLLSGVIDSEISTRDKDLPEPPAEPKPSLSALTSQSLSKSSSPPLNVSKFKGNVSASVVPETTSVKKRNAENVAVHHFATKRLPEILQNSKTKPSTLQRAAEDHCSPEISSKSRSKVSNQGRFSVGFNKPQKRPFASLFANPLRDPATPASDPATPASDPATPASDPATPASDPATPASDPATPASDPATPASDPATPASDPATPASDPATPASDPATPASDPATPASDPATPASDPATPACSKAPQTAGVRNKTSWSFTRLFAAPLSETPLSSQQSAENPNSNPKQRPSGLETTSSRIRTDDKQNFHRQTSEIFQSPETEADAVKQQVSPVSSESECNPEQQRLADVLSPGETSANSILKTLFLHLKPYQEDGELQDRRRSLAPSKSQQRKSCSEDAILNKQQKIQQKNESTVEAASHPAELRRSSQTPPASSEAAGGSTITCSGETDPQGRDSGTHTFPFKLVTQLAQHPRRMRAKPTLRK